MKERCRKEGSAPSLLLLLSVLIAGGGLKCEDGGRGSEPKEMERIVARVNDSVLREDELKDAIAGFFGEVYSDGGGSEYVEQWVESELLYQKALEEGLQRDEEVQKKVSQFRHMLLEQEVLRNYLDGEVEVTDEEINEFYDENMEMFTRSEGEYRLEKLIFQDEEAARRIREELNLAPERYKALISEETPGGGITVVDLGFYSLSELRETFGEQVDQLEVGAVSQPIMVSPRSYYILRATEYEDKGSIRELEEVEAQIRGILLREKGEKAKRMWIEELKREADIEVSADFAH